MECSSNYSIAWFYDESPIITYECRAIHLDYIAKLTEDGCHLTAIGSYGVQGPYWCYDGGNILAEAVAIVIGNFNSSVTLVLYKYVKIIEICRQQ